MNKLEKTYRLFFHFIMALASTSLLPVLYLIKVHYGIFSFECNTLNHCLDLGVLLLTPIIMSLLALWWMKHQSSDSILNGVEDIAPVNHEYLPVYLGYIFVSLSLPTLPCGKIDWLTSSAVYLLICIFVTFSKTLCFNPLFIVFGYGYYQVKTKNGVKLFVITKKIIRKGDESTTFPDLRKVNELVYLDVEQQNKKQS